MLLGEIKGAIMSSLKSKIGGLFIKSSLKGLKSRFSASEYGGAPLLGLNGLVVKIHGNSKEGEVISAIRQCLTFVDQDVNGLIAKGLADEVAEESLEASANAAE